MTLTKKLSICGVLATASVLSCGSTSLMTEPLKSVHDAGSPTGRTEAAPESLAPKPKPEGSGGSPQPTATSTAESIASKKSEGSSFHRVLDGMGSIVVQGGERIWYGEEQIFNLTTHHPIQSCEYLTGVALAGQSKWFAAQLDPFSACPRDVWLTRGSESGFQRVKPLRVHDIKTTTWKQRATLAAVVPYREGPPWGYEVHILEGGGAPPIVTSGPQVSLFSNSEKVPCHSALQRPLVIRGFFDGALFVVGEGACGQGPKQDNRVSFEYWAPGRRRGTFTSLPLDEFQDLAVVSSTEVYLLGRRGKDEDFSEEAMESALFAFDGKTWSELTVATQGVERLALGGKTGRELLGLRSGVLASLKLEPGDHAKSLKLAEACQQVLHVWQDGDASWLHCATGLYTTDRGVEPFELPKTAQPCPALDAQPAKEFGAQSRGGKKRSARPSPSCGGRARPARPL